MNNENTRLGELLYRFKTQTATKAELEELTQLLNSAEAEKSMQQYWEQVPGEGQFFDEGTSQQMLAAIHQSQQPAVLKHTSRRITWLAAAAVSAVLALGAWLYSTNSSSVTPAVKTTAATTAPVITPGSNKAVLVLGDGTQILLDSTGNGNLSSAGNTTIVKVNGQLSYNNGENPEAAFNTLVTPKGGQYQVVLADGTTVWMNAASSLRYPTAFIGAEREVELQGEAYFEVAKNQAKPFKVKVNGMEVQVLGTHFNIMAYQNEAVVKTTLLEGAVNVKEGGNAVLLKPGQQALRTQNAPIKVISDVDTEEAVAWKNGYFKFNSDGLDVVLRQIERWYDVTVSNEGPRSGRKFSGKISRTSDIKDVLKVLELSKVTYRIEGKKIVVTNN